MIDPALELAEHKKKRQKKIIHDVGKMKIFHRSATEVLSYFSCTNRHFEFGNSSDKSIESSTDNLLRHFFESWLRWRNNRDHTKHRGKKNSRVRETRDSGSEFEQNLCGRNGTGDRCLNALLASRKERSICGRNTWAYTQAHIRTGTECVINLYGCQKL